LTAGSDISLLPDLSGSRYWRGCRPRARFIPRPHIRVDVLSSTIQDSIWAMPYAVSPVRGSGVRSNCASTRSIIALVESTSALRWPWQLPHPKSFFMVSRHVPTKREVSHGFKAPYVFYAKLSRIFLASEK